MEADWIENPDFTNACLDEINSDASQYDGRTNGN